ncbi:MAG: nucleotidyltransferase family protein [Oscillospiraceae bacterium]|nr:nucleotidyltransferase family protein [Oscillospiraceae bacterium]
MKALILAAGYATRMYPLTLNCPKALLPIGGGTMLDIIAGKIAEIPRIEEIVIVANHRFYSMIKEWADNFSSPVKVTVLDDGTSSETDRLGAVGDIVYAIDNGNIDDDLLIMACDNLFNFSLADLYRFFGEKASDCVCAGIMEDTEEIKRYGVIEADGDGNILSFVEKPRQPRTDLAAYAIYMYKRETLPLFRQYLSENRGGDSPGKFLEWLCGVKKVCAYRFSGECFDIGTIPAYEEVCKYFG